jgi:hypothetical protein
MIQPRIADCYYGNDVNFTQVATWAWAVIHKCTQGPGFHDPKYLQRKAIAKGLGLLWGAYDFSTNDDPAKNVADFEARAAIEDGDIPVLDFEDNRFSNMDGNHCYEWLDAILQKYGRAMIYGGNHLTDYDANSHHPRIDPQQSRWVDMAAKVPLWRCRYLNRPILSNGDLFNLIGTIPPWKKCAMIQYAADGSGPAPHQQPGVQNGADLNAFLGTRDQLALMFAGKSGWDAVAAAA